MHALYTLQKRKDINTKANYNSPIFQQGGLLAGVNALEHAQNAFNTRFKFLF